MPAQKTFRSIRVRGVARFDGPVVGVPAGSGGGSGPQVISAVALEFNSIFASATRFLCPQSVGQVGIFISFNETLVQMLFPVAGKLRNLHVSTNSQQSEFGALQLVARVNEADTPLAVVVPAGAPPGIYSNNEAEAEVEAGALVAVRMTNQSDEEQSALIKKLAMTFTPN